MIVLAVLAPVLTGYDPAAYSGSILSPPSWQHLLGTNDVGHDVWSRLIYGARTSLLVGAGAAVLSTFISILIGCIAALFGGLYDRIVMRTVDALLVIPPVLIIILVAAYLRPNILLLIILLGCLLWPGGARVVRAQTLSLQERLHVNAARTFGAGWMHLLLRHIIPDLGPIIIAMAIQDARRAVFMEAGLSFLGVADPGLISWGKMIHSALGFTYLNAWKWWLIPPGLALAITITALTFTGYSLEKALNPRLKKGDNHAEH